MKKKTIRLICGLIFLLAPALSLLFLQGCELPGMSIEDRIDNFMEDLNSSDRSNAYKNFHPSETAAYNAIKPDAYWNTPFPEAYMTYSLSGLDIGDDSASATINSSDNGAWGGPHVIHFNMAKDGTDWQIQSLSFDADLPFIE